MRFSLANQRVNLVGKRDPAAARCAPPLPPKGHELTLVLRTMGSSTEAPAPGCDKEERSAPGTRLDTRKAGEREGRAAPHMPTFTHTCDLERKRRRSGKKIQEWA